MLGVTLFGLFLTPVFYVAIRHLVIWLGRFRRRPAALPGGAAHSPAE